jgi:hypothetical protein
MSTEHPLRNPELSIVIVNSDSSEHTLACLDSIFLHPPEMPYEVILVDNCSTVSCLPVVAEVYPEVRRFGAPQKQGFARNYNLGIRQATGEFILILNNDTVVLPGTIDRLVRALQFNPNYGMVGPQLRSRNWRVQSVCARRLPTPWDYLLWQFLTDPGIPTGRLFEYLRQRRVARQRSGPVPCISGACMLVIRRALEQVGLLDEGYDFYYEDIEWCHRMQKRGYQVAYIAESKLFHLGDQSLSKVKEWAKRSEYLSAQRYFRQYYHVNTAWLRAFWLATLSGFALRALAFLGWEILTRKPGYSCEYQRLTRWVWSQSPGRASAGPLDPVNTLQYQVGEGE